MQFGVGKADIVRRANAVQKTLTGDFDQIRQMVESADVVIAVWQDRQEPDGVGMLVIKGQAILVIATQVSATLLKLTAIPCIEAEQAEALRQVCGEGVASH